jgi:signal peptidase II
MATESPKQVKARQCTVHTLSEKSSAYGGLCWLWLSLMVIFLDHLSKLWVLNNLVMYEPVKILPLMNFTLSYNQGAAFSFLAGWGEYAVSLFSVVAIIVSIVLVVWLARVPKNGVTLAMALSLILGGALGNLIDRIFRGYVVDFIQLHYHQLYFATFNIADAAISIGAVLLLLSSLRRHTIQGRHHENSIS